MISHIRHHHRSLKPAAILGARYTLNAQPSEIRPMTDRRDNVMKVRLSDEERKQIDESILRERPSTRAEFLRQRGLAPLPANTDLAEIIGRLGLAINALGPRKPKAVTELRDELRNLTKALLPSARPPIRARLCWLQSPLLQLPKLLVCPGCVVRFDC